MVKQVGQRERRQGLTGRYKGILIAASELVANSKLMKEREHVNVAKRE